MAVTAGDGSTAVGPSAFGQVDAGVRFEWGLAGARAVGHPDGALVVVDVLSFSTSATVAVGAGSVVYPHRWPDPAIDAFAAAHDAIRAARRHEVTADHPWSLSPAHLLAAPAAARLVLPSPNGSTIAAAFGSGSGGAGTVVAGSLRNASAVARWLRHHHFGTRERPVAVVAAGEKWHSGELRPALEDLLGAGAIIEALGLADALSPGVLSPEALSPEAGAAAAAWRAERQRLADVLHRSSTGRHLGQAGYGSDVDVAAAHDAQDTVPVMSDGAFRAGER